MKGRESRGLSNWKFYEFEIHFFRIPVTTLDVPRRGDADFHRSDSFHRDRRSNQTIIVHQYHSNDGKEDEWLTTEWNE